MREFLNRVVAISFLWSITVNVSANLIGDLPPRQWLEVPNSDLRQVAPSPLPTGNTGLSSVMIAWSGGDVDTKRNRLIVWGGGHGDYSGNEVYAFSLENLAWERLSDPGGQPVSTHSYNHVVYADNKDRFYTMGQGGIWPDGNWTNYCGGFDMTTNSWIRANGKPSFGEYDAAVTGYNPRTGYVWYQPGGDTRILRYDPIGDTWLSFDTGIYGVPGLGLTAAIDTNRNQMVIVGQGYVSRIDLDDPTNSQRMPLKGNTTIAQNAWPGFTYDSNSDQFVGWDGGTTVYTLDPDTFEWSAVSAASGNNVSPTAPPSQGTFGRFRYVPALNVFVLVNSVDENVYIYRLTSGAGATRPKPPVVFQ